MNIHHHTKNVQQPFDRPFKTLRAKVDTIPMRVSKIVKKMANELYVGDVSRSNSITFDVC